MVEQHLEASVLRHSEALETAERDASYRFREKQLRVMLRRHSVESIITLQVLADHAHEAAQYIKAERLATARKWLVALEGIELPSHPEFEQCRSLSILPVWALLHWRARSPTAAIRCLESALRAGHILAKQFGHTYLTTKRIHLAANIARVHQSAGAGQSALALVLSLRRVIAGDSDCWPYGGGSTVDVPLEGPDREILERQLRRTESLVIATRLAPTRASA